ncbi:MAG: M1 family metallopeptidase [Deltaproteobacteria bacterium]|nr:M1 family metallopeptidase [Deltaproteobacteria bacterium]
MRKLLVGAALAALGASCSHTPPRVTARVETSGAPDAAAVATPAEVPAPREDGRLPPLARPTRYELALEVDPGQASFTGVARIALEVPSPTRAVVLHGRGLTVRAVTAEVNGRTVSGEARARMAHGGREAPEELVVTFPEALPAGSAALVFRYEAPFDPHLRGLYRVEVDRGWYGFTDCEPNGARRIYPGFDEPGFKVPFALTLTVPEAMTAVANMPEAERSAPSGGRVTYRFQPTPPLPTYLLAFAVGTLEFHQGPTAPVPIRVVTVRGRSAHGALAAETASQHLPILAEYFDRPYPYPKLDLVAVPDFLPGAMENPGLITFRDALLLLDPAHASVAARHAMAQVTAHELAHQWFGDLVTMTWWDDLWLNEGFASWMGPRVVDRWRPELGAAVDEVGSRTWARSIDTDPPAHAIRQPVRSSSDAVSAFDGTTYQKGASIIAMIESYLGPDAFRQGIRTYIREHAEGSATAADLLDALQRTTGRDVAPIANSFLDQPGLPLVRMTLRCAAGAPATLGLAQSRYAPRGAEHGTLDQRWAVPVCVRYDAPGGAREACTLLSEPQGELALPGSACPRWVRPNARQTGHYWYRLEPAQLRALLRSPGALDPPATLDLLGDLEALLKGGEVPAELWLDALDALFTSRDPHVRDHLLGALWRLDRRIVTPASRAAFRRWVTARVGPWARALGWAPRPGEGDLTRGLRRTTLSILGQLTEDPWARQNADQFAARWLQDPASVDGDVAPVALCVSTRRGDAARWEALHAAFTRAALPQERATALSAMGCFDDLSLVRRTYDLSLGDELRVQDARALFRSQPTEAHRAMANTWLHANFDALVTRWQGGARGALWLLGGLCDEATIREAEAFFSPRAQAQEGFDQALHTAVQDAFGCAALRARVAPGADAWFSRR